MSKTLLPYPTVSRDSFTNSRILSPNSVTVSASVHPKPSPNTSLEMVLALDKNRLNKDDCELVAERLDDLVRDRITATGNAYRA
jgi:hypothetical protein